MRRVRVSLTFICLVLAAPGAAPHAAAAETRGAMLVLGAQARFASDGATLAPAGRAVLERLVARIAEHGEPLAIRVVGHTDSVGPEAYNLALSARRAAFVGRAIERRYPAAALLTVGAGESSPIADNATARGRARNRRVEIHVIARAAASAAGVADRR